MIDIEKYFKKGELIPAIVQEEGTNEEIGRASCRERV